MSIENAVKKLEGRGFNVKRFETKEAAAQWINGELDGREIGFGGSMTLKDMGLYELLESHNSVYWGWKDKSAETMVSANRAPVFITGANAIAETGEIVNIDGRGNRITGYLYNKEATYIVAGTNKLCPTLDEAIYRARNVAAPLNAKRMGRNTPCAVDGKCHDCRSKDRVCRALTVLMTPMMDGGDVTVVLIDEELGL